MAKELLGTLLVRIYQQERLVGRIVETEAYDGPHDLASHASKGRTERTSVMFGPAGYTYLYFTYGMHWMLNFVTGPLGYPAAVLVRAVEPLEGLSTMCHLRRTSNINTLTSGPSRLCQALALDKKLNGKPLDASLGLWLEKVPDTFYFFRVAIGQGPRIGVDYAGAYRHKPWRYYVKENPFVSR